jgi:hypothetical protein
MARALTSETEVTEPASDFGRCVGEYPVYSGLLHDGVVHSGQPSSGFQGPTAQATQATHTVVPHCV